MDLLWRDVRYAIRRLGGSPAFTVVAVLTLALGIGANTAIFSVVNAVLLRPLPYEDPSSLVMVNETRPEGTPNVVSFLNFEDWRSQSTGFEALTLFRSTRLNLGGRGEPERISGALVSADFFRVLAVAPALGRRFAPGEDRAGDDRVAVISHELWQRRFAGDPGIIGQPVIVDGRALTLIGVAPAGLRYPERAELWIPVSHDAADILDNRGLHGYSVIGRLRPGVSLEEAGSQMAALAARLAEEYPATNKGWGVVVRPLHDVLVQDVRPTLLVLLGAVGFVLLIASANVANMMLARSAGRRRELSIHTALGATRWRLARQLLTESLVLALLGGALGLLLAVWGADALLALAPDELPAGEGAVVDAAVLGFTLTVAVITSLAFGLVPAVQTARPDLGALRDGGRGSAGVDRQRTRRLLVVAEIALALLLLIGAGLMVQSFLRLQSADAGFNSDGVVTARLSLPRAEYADTGRVIRFYETLVERAGRLPGVVSAAAISHVPLGGEGARYRFSVEGQPFVEPQLRPGADVSIVTPGYLATLEISLLQGRDFGPEDRRGAPDVVLVNQTLARRFWPGEVPLGKRLSFGEPEENAWMTVVGVVADVKHRSLTAEPRPQVYAPEAQVGVEEMSLLIRTALEPSAVGRTVRGIVRELDQGVPVSDVQTMGEVRGASVSTDRFRTLVLGSFALLALALAAIGIYGVISYGVAQRSHEIGIRMALGARRSEILSLIVGDGMITVAIGIAIGVAAAVGLSRFLASLLYAVEPHDPATFAAIATLIFAVALAACVVPARRALRLDPVKVLRAE